MKLVIAIVQDEDSSRLIALETGEIDICQDPAALEHSQGQSQRR